MKNNKGIFISFDGIDGVGKSTHLRFYKEVLEATDHDVLLVREPGGTVIGEKIRSILLDKENAEMADRTELFLYLAARAQIVEEVIRPALEAGKIVLCDRFIDSTVAYQGYGRGLDPDFIKMANSFATAALVPDATVMFYANEETRSAHLKSRESMDRIEVAGEAFSNSVKAGFDKIAKDEGRVFMIDASGKHSETASKLLHVLNNFVQIDKDCEMVRAMLRDLDEEHAK